MLDIEGADDWKLVDDMVGEGGSSVETRDDLDLLETVNSWENRRVMALPFCLGEDRFRSSTFSSCRTSWLMLDDGLVGRPSSARGLDGLNVSVSERSALVAFDLNVPELLIP